MDFFFIKYNFSLQWASLGSRDRWHIHEINWKVVYHNDIHRAWLRPMTSDLTFDSSPINTDFFTIICLLSIINLYDFENQVCWICQGKNRSTPTLKSSIFQIDTTTSSREWNKRKKLVFFPSEGQWGTSLLFFFCWNKLRRPPQWEREKWCVNT